MLKRIEITRAKLAEKLNGWFTVDSAGDMFVFPVKPILRKDEGDWFGSDESASKAVFVSEDIFCVTDLPKDWQKSLTPPPIIRKCWCGSDIDILDQSVVTKPVFTVVCSRSLGHFKGPMAKNKDDALSLFDNMVIGFAIGTDFEEEEF